MSEVDERKVESIVRDPVASKSLTSVMLAQAVVLLANALGIGVEEARNRVVESTMEWLKEDFK